MFDEEVKVHFVSDLSDPTTSHAEHSRNVMVKIADESVDNQKCLILEIYDQNEPLFFYRGCFTHSQFEEIRIAQKLKYSFGKAATEIISTIKESRSPTSKSSQDIQLTVREKSSRFEVVQRSRHQDVVILSLELRRMEGEALCKHLLRFINKYKKRADANSDAEKRCESLQREHSNMAKSYEEKISNLEDDQKELEDMLRKAEDEVSELSAKNSSLQSNEKALKMAYAQLQAEFETCTSDNENFVSQLDDYEQKMEKLLGTIARNQSKVDSLQHKIAYSERVIEQHKAKLRETESKYATLKASYKKLEDALKQKTWEWSDFEANLNSQMADLTKRFDALSTHKDLLETQLKECQQQLAEKERAEKARIEKMNKRIFPARK